MTGAEALILADHIKKHWSPEAIADLRPRLNAANETYRKIAENSPTIEIEEQKVARLRRPCAMLDESAGRCLAYEARPVNCRRENSVDVEVCRRYREDPEETESSLRVVRADVIWGAVQVFLSRWTSRHLSMDDIRPLEVALAETLRPIEAAASDREIREDLGDADDQDEQT